MQIAVTIGNTLPSRMIRHASLLRTLGVGADGHHSSPPGGAVSGFPKMTQLLARPSGNSVDGDVGCGAFTI